SISAFLHPEGVYDDPKGGLLRRDIYQRLHYHFHFQNEARLFPIAPVSQFSINIYGLKHKPVKFKSISNLFLAKTINSCFQHDGNGKVPGVKDDNNKLETIGHLKRIATIGENDLKLFAKLYDPEGTPSLDARLPNLHSSQIISVLTKFANQQKRIIDLKGEYHTTQHWNEVNSQKDGTICKKTIFPNYINEWIISGPHFHVGNPLFKTPRRVCTQKEHYDVLDHAYLSDKYIPRSNFIPKCNREEYLKKSPKVAWDSTKLSTEFYRILSRTMLSRTGERTLISAIFPPFVAHLDLAFSITLRDIRKIPFIGGLLMSIPYDFFVKTTGKGHFRNDVANQLPIPDKFTIKIRSTINLRSLTLNCVTSYYSELWNVCWEEIFTADKWAKSDIRLSQRRFENLTPQWKKEFSLQNEYERRHALVELDVLTAMALNMTLEELKTIYYIQFNVLKNIETNTWYDQKGNIVFIKKKGFADIGFPRKASKTDPIGWEDIKDMTSGTVSRTVMDDTMPGGPIERTITYEAPFDRCDREKDYEVVWKEFERRFKEQEDQA
ncbi:MAG: hypothetical protein HQK65_06345, partial [Desulfamplus sp.]|nr:hypothetical protein [Desulfamplus sp.]